MNREILFRGKRQYTGEWAESVCPLGVMHSGHLCDDFIPATVGQYTGLKDKNGRRIFEGDVVEGHCHSAWAHRLQRCEVAYGRDGFEARHHIGGLDSDYYTYRVLFSKDVVVIGNIHDNPELIGGNEDVH